MQNRLKRNYEAVIKLSWPPAIMIIRRLRPITKHLVGLVYFITVWGNFEENLQFVDIAHGKHVYFDGYKTYHFEQSENFVNI